MRFKMKFLLLFLSFALLGCGEKRPQKISYRVISHIPHDAESYTQGLEFRNGKLIESSGGYGSSNLRIVEPKTGEVLRRRKVSERVFAEGITVLKNELWLLSWKEGLAAVLNPETLSFVRSHNYQGEGWGLANNGRELIMSDGSAMLKFIDPHDFSVIRSVEVTDGGKPVEMLNELEYDNDSIWANIYLSDQIARIDATTGKVTGWLDLGKLRGHLAGARGNPEALNGIARDPSSGRYFVTGKNWPLMFELEIDQ